MTEDLRIEIPVARAIVKRHGRERGLEIIAALADPTDHDAHTAAYDALGSKIERSDPEHGPVLIQSVFAMHEVLDPETGDTDYNRTTFWDTGGVVMLGRTLPEAIAIAARGKPVETIIDHPFARGLVMDDVDVRPVGDDPCIVINLVDPSCALHAVANHIRSE